MATEVLTRVDIPGFGWKQEKVRDWALVESEMRFRIIITTDRISAFDVVLPNAIPGKGRVLNQLSLFWKGLLEPVIPNDVISADLQTCLPYLGLTRASEWAEVLKGRIVLVREIKMAPVECVVRGYLAGSCWQEYRERRGEKPIARQVLILGHQLPGNLRESEALPQPIFTPATKSSQGHDINLTYREMVNHLGLWLEQHPKIKKLITAELLAQNLKSTSLALYLIARDYARQCGIIIADTKFEFGLTEEGILYLADEVLTPDSSRFWDAATWRPGGSQPSYDKQPLRDWLVASGWNKEPPAPELPPEIVAATKERYQEAYQRLVGQGVLA